MTRMNRGERRVGWNAFTLVELLVVIAIIAILMGFIIPLLTNIREKGRAAKCVSNLKQLHTATMTFSADSGSLPAGCSAENIEDSTNCYQVAWGWLAWFQYRADLSTYWHDASGVKCITNGTLWPYTGDIRIYLCPTAQSKNPFTGTDWGGSINAVRTYSMNASMSKFNWYDIKDASRRMLFADAAIYVNRALENSAAPSVNYTTRSLGNSSGGDYGTAQEYRRNIGRDGMMETAGLMEGLGAWHNGYAHCVFVDGHVERVWYTNSIAVCAGTWGAID